MLECVFCEIISGKIPCDIIYQTDRLIVIRDANPISPVHILIIPKEHIQSLNEVEDASIYQEMQECAVRMAKELKVADAGYRIIINTGKAGGQSVGHLHMHLIGGRDLGWPAG